MHFTMQFNAGLSEEKVIQFYPSWLKHCIIWLIWLKLMYHNVILIFIQVKSLDVQSLY